MKTMPNHAVGMSDRPSEQLSGNIVHIQNNDGTVFASTYRATWNKNR